MKTVVVIGAGVIGLSTAYYCAKKGHCVIVIERRGPLRNGCSFINAGMIVPSHFVPLAAPGMVALGLKWMWHPESPFYIQPRFNWELLDWAFKFWRAANPRHVARSAPLLRDLHWASRECFEELQTALGDFGLTTRGLLMLCRTQRGLDEEAHLAAQANDLGVPAIVLDAKQTAQLDPAITMNIAGSVYFAKDCHLEPTRFMAALEAGCRSLGVEFVWNAEATRFTSESSRIDAVHTTQGDFAADEMIVCGGSWSPSLARSLGLKLPMQAGKGYSFDLEKPRQLPQICAILSEARVAVTPMGSTLRFGGTMEISGLNEQINPARVRGILQSIPQYYPEFTAQDFTEIEPHAGLRPCSPDGLPYLGRTQRFTNVSLATGHAMMGLSLGPITGKLMAQIVSGEVPDQNLELLSPDRFA
jgi:D-amino-acid dehydrogenase